MINSSFFFDKELGVDAIKNSEKILYQKKKNVLFINLKSKMKNIFSIFITLNIPAIESCNSNI